MALQMKVATKVGVDAYYHRIYRIDEFNLNTMKIHGWMGGYVSKEVRDVDMDSILLTEEFSMPVTEEVKQMVCAYVYPKIIESKKEDVLVSPAVPAVLDEQGDIVTPEVPAVYNNVETNPWALAQVIENGE